MSIFTKFFDKSNKEEMDKQLTDYCKSIGIQKKNICDSVIKNCIQNVNDPDLFDENKFKFENDTEIENDKKCTLAWGRNMNEQVYNIIQSYNLKYLVKKRDTIFEDNLYSKEFTPEKWINKLVPNNLKSNILHRLAPYSIFENKRIRSNRINNFNENKSFIFSKTLIEDIVKCNDNSKIGQFYLTIDHKNRELLINLFKKDKNNENYENLKTNINIFMNEIDINIKNLTYDDVVMLMYIYMNEKLPYTDVDKHLYTSKKKLICFIIKRFIEIYSSVENKQILDSVEEWCSYVHKNKSLNDSSVFDYVNKNIGNITHIDIYLGFDINIPNIKDKIQIYTTIYKDFINIKPITNFEKIDKYINEYDPTKILYIKLLCKIFKLTNEDFIYNLFFYIVKKSIFDNTNFHYNNFLYYLFINYTNIYEISDHIPPTSPTHIPPTSPTHRPPTSPTHIPPTSPTHRSPTSPTHRSPTYTIQELHKLLNLIKNSIIKISQHANDGTYDDKIILNKDTIKKYFGEIKPLKLITSEMVERLINNIRQINNKTEYQIDTIPIENAIKKSIKEALLVSTTDLASEMDIYKKLNTVQVQLPIEKKAIYDIRFILKNLQLFKKDLQPQKIKDYSWIYPIERVYSYYSDNVDYNNLYDVNEYFKNSIKLINSNPIMTTTYDELLYLFEFFNEYNRRKHGKPIQTEITDAQFITNLKSQLQRIKYRTKSKIFAQNEFEQINQWFYIYLKHIIKNKNFHTFSNNITHEVTKY